MAVATVCVFKNSMKWFAYQTHDDLDPDLYLTCRYMLMYKKKNNSTRCHFCFLLSVIANHVTQ